MVNNTSRKENKKLFSGANTGNDPNYRELVKKRLRHVASRSSAREFSAGRFLAPKYYADIYNWNYSVAAGGLFRTVPANYSRYFYSSSFPWDLLIWEDFVPSNEIPVSLHHSPCFYFIPLYDTTPLPVSLLPTLCHTFARDRLLDDTHKHEESSEPRDSRRWRSTMQI